MSKPEPIVINFVLKSWAIEYSLDGYDIGDIGPDFVPYQVTVYWGPENGVIHRNVESPVVEKRVRTLEEAKAFLAEETGLEYV